MQAISEYQLHAEKFLKDAGIEFSAVLIGSDCPQFCDDARNQIDMDKVDVYPRHTHIHGKHYRVTLQRLVGPSPKFITDFYNSYADEEFNYKYSRGFVDWPKPQDWFAIKKAGKRRVTAYDVLACITKNDPGTFEIFCGDFGYDSDSRRAEQTYHAVQDEWKQVKGFFTTSELEQLQEIS